jgi:hypothetical protein
MDNQPSGFRVLLSDFARMKKGTISTRSAPRARQRNPKAHVAVSLSDGPPAKAIEIDATIACERYLTSGSGRAFA